MRSRASGIAKESNQPQQASSRLSQCPGDETLVADHSNFHYRNRTLLERVYIAPHSRRKLLTPSDWACLEMISANKTTEIHAEHVVEKIRMRSVIDVVALGSDLDGTCVRQILVCLTFRQ